MSVWIQWLAWFFLKEIPAAMNTEKGDTFSEFVWHIKNARPWTKYLMIAGLTDLYFHLAFETPLWPF